MPRPAPFLAALCLLFVVACGDDAVPPTTTAPATTTTVVEPTTTVPSTTTLPPEPTTTTLGTGTLIDLFDGSTPAVPSDVQPTELTWDLGVSGFLTIGNAAHPDPGFGLVYAALYPHSFRDGIVTMRFRPGVAPGDTRYLMFLWTDAEFTRYVEVEVTEEDTVIVIGITPENPPTQQTLFAPAGTFDPAGFNELRVEAFDGVLTVALNGIGLGDVFDAAPIHEGRVGFGFRSYQAGSEMTLDEFRIEPEVS